MLSFRVAQSHVTAFTMRLAAGIDAAARRRHDRSQRSCLPSPHVGTVAITTAPKKGPDVACLLQLL